MIFLSIREASVCFTLFNNKQQGHNVDVIVHILELNRDFEETCFLGT